MPDRILLHGAQFFARHGVSDEERRVGGRFVVDVELSFDLARAGKSDDLRDTISYAELYNLVREIVEGGSFRLVEMLAETIAQKTLSLFSADAVLVRVKKQPPPLEGIIDFAGVEIYRERKNNL
ncbi:MAG: dihydroneopterin aldolase [Chloroflexi bacterium]|nr:dihydroneopterin aldolase [Chloroflexota bacterium]